MKLSIFSGVIAAVLFVSCGTTQKTASADNQNSSNVSGPMTKIPTETFWKLNSLKGKDYSSYTHDSNPIGFTMFGDNKKVSGYAGCNNFFATYNIEPGNRINFSQIGATKMMCPDASFNENDFLDALANAAAFNLEKNKLELTSAAGDVLAVFYKEGKALEPIVEKYWKLKTLEGQPVKMEDNQEREVYFILKSDTNRVTGFAGCNTITGQYTLKKGERIRFSKMATTMMACPDISFNESEFMKVFELADNYTINGNELSLNVGRRAPLAVFEAVEMD